MAEPLMYPTRGRMLDLVYKAPLVTGGDNFRTRYDADIIQEPPY